MKRQHIKLLLLLLLVIAPVVLIYLPMRGHEPLLDDPLQIDYINEMDSIWDSFKPDSVNWYRPFKNVVFYLTYGEDGSVYWVKLACLGLFVANIFIAYFLLDRLFGGEYWSLLGAALFAYNPTMVSTVQFMSACNNQICLMFMMLCLWLSMIYSDRTDGQPKDKWPKLVFSLSLLFAMFALVAYEASISIAGMVIVLLFARHGWKYCISSHGVRMWGGIILVLIAYLILRVNSAKMEFISPSLPFGTTRWELILRAPYYAWAHFLLWIEPWGRGGVFLDDNPAGKTASGIVGWCVLALVVGVLIRLLFTRYRIVAAGLLIFLGGMTPLANFLGLGNGPICNYYLLVPGIGLVIAVVALIKELWSMPYPAIRWALVVCLLGVLPAQAWNSRVRVIAWRSQPALVDFTVQNYPDNYHGLTLQGLDAVRNGEYDLGQQKLARGRELAPWALPGYLYSAYGFRLAGDLSAAWDVLSRYEEVNRRQTWLIAERMAEIALQQRDWAEVDRQLTFLLSVEPHPMENCRFYIRVVIPYFIMQGRLDEARYLLEELEGTCNSGKYSESLQLQKHRDFLSQH